MQEIVIKIPKSRYKLLQRQAATNLGKEKLDEFAEAVLNGTVLPKGHGRLIILSEDAVKREQTPLSFSCQNWISEVGISNATVAIIEADRSEE